MDWYYALENQDQQGPIDDATFQRLIAEGTIRDDTFVWNETLASWIPYVELRLDPPKPIAPPPLKAETAHVLQPKTRFQKTFFILVIALTAFGLVLEFLLGVGADPILGVGYITFQRGLYWLAVLLGGLALIEQGGRPPRSLRVCVVVPFVMLLTMPFFFNTAIRFLVAQDGLDGIAMVFLRGLGYATRLIDLACAIYGLKLLRRT